MSDDRGFDPRYDPAFQRGWDAPEVEERAAATPAPVADRIVVAPESTPLVEEVERGGVNPFLVALGALSVLLVAAGVWMASRVSDGYLQQGPSTQVDYAILQVLMIASPLTVLLGVLTAIGMLFVFAVRWRR